MFLKKGFYILIFSLLVFSFSSCLFDDDDDDYDYVLNDAQLISLSLSHDSISDLASVVFSIDQEKGLIYNYDSMAYGTDIYESVVMTYTSASGADNLLNITDGDSVWIAQSDSVDVSKPLKFKVFALDGVTTKTYSFQLNIHQVDPDSAQYQRIASNVSFLQDSENKTIYFDKTFYAFSVKDNMVRLHTSGDLLVWNESPLSGLPENVLLESIICSKDYIYACTKDGDLLINYGGFLWDKVPTDYPVAHILGFLEETRDGYGHLIQEGGLSLIVQKEDEHVFVFAPSNDLLNWNYGTSVPQDFPVSGFSGMNMEISKIQRLIIVGGTMLSGEMTNAMWTTDTGLYWAMINDNRFNSLPEINGANVFFYDEKIFVINGKLKSGGYNDLFYYSEDNGFTWTEGPDKYKMTPSGYLSREGASLVLDEESKYFYILGGTNNLTSLSDIWKGFFNKRVFDY